MRMMIGVAALLVTGGVAVAQQHVEADVLKIAPPGAGSAIPHVLAYSGDAQMNVEFIAAELSGKVVSGAPYSAEEVTETKQTLADGNRILRRNSAMAYRDSQGRTRREQSFGAIGLLSADAKESGRSIVINDPVAGVNYVLDPVAKTARKLPAVDVFTHAQAAEKVPAWDAASPLRHAPEPAAREVFEREVVIAGSRVAGNQASADHVPGAGVQVTIRHVEAGQVNKESIGKQVIEGVEAEGTRVTVTIPAGEIGNELPIQTVSESWYSPRLQTVVLSKQSDPRMGDTTFRLTNLTLGEPAPGLFQVPADYKIVEAPKTVIFKSSERDR